MGACAPLHCKTYPLFVNPRRACAARVTVCLSVCLSAQHLTSRASFRPENHITYSTGNEGPNVCGVFSKTASLRRSSNPSVVCHHTAAIFPAHALTNEARQLTCASVRVNVPRAATPSSAGLVVATTLWLNATWQAKDNP